MLVQLDGLVEVQLVCLRLLLVEAQVLQEEVDAGQEGSLQMLGVGGGGGLGWVTIQ